MQIILTNVKFSYSTDFFDYPVPSRKLEVYDVNSQSVYIVKVNISMYESKSFDAFILIKNCKIVC